MVLSFLKNRSSVAGPRPLVVLGSSNSEQFDYIFGDNPRYHPFWASGWSARGLRQERAGGYLDTILAPVDRRALVLLNFGATDVNWNAPHRAATLGEFQFPRFLAEARDGIVNARSRVRELGFRAVHAVFSAPPTDHDAATWADWGVKEQLPVMMRAAMYAHLAALVAKTMPTVNLIPALSVSPERPVLAPRFHRDFPGHHPDYVAAQEIVWEAIRALPGMLPRRPVPHRALYPHRPGPIHELKAQGSTRPRSCV